MAMRQQTATGTAMIAPMISAASTSPGVRSTGGAGAAAIADEPAQQIGQLATS